MDIRKVEKEDGIVIFLEGMFSLSDRNKFREAALLYPEDNAKKIVLDCLKLDTIDSSGIGMLLIMHESATSRGAKVQAINVGKHIRPLFEHSALGSLFEVQYTEPSEQNDTERAEGTYDNC